MSPWRRTPPRLALDRVLPSAPRGCVLASRKLAGCALASREMADVLFPPCGSLASPGCAAQSCIGPALCSAFPQPQPATLHPHATPHAVPPPLAPLLRTNPKTLCTLHPLGCSGDTAAPLCPFTASPPKPCLHPNVAVPKTLCLACPGACLARLMLRRGRLQAGPILPARRVPAICNLCLVDPFVYPPLSSYTLNSGRSSRPHP